MTNVLIDAKNLLFRAHFAHGELKDSKDRPTSAIYGFLDGYRAIRGAFPTANFIVCWENGCLSSKSIAHAGGASWRRKLFPEYKANRHTANDQRYMDALAQVPAIVEALDMLGVYQLEVPGLEADDTLALLAAAALTETVIYSADFDLTQLLVHPHVKLARPKYKATGYDFMTTRELEEKHGVAPLEWPKFRALSGDASDNIKVLKGVGAVGALKILRGGINPAHPTFDMHSRKVQAAFPQLKVHWARLHAAYRISVLPHHVEQIPDTSVQQHTCIRFELYRALAHRTNFSSHELSIRVQAFQRFCGDFDIVSFLGYVGNFFPLH